MMEGISLILTEEKLIEIVKGIVDERRNNPKYWKNNKRKMHRYPLKRRCGYQKSKKLASRRMFFSVIQNAVDDILGKFTHDEFFEKFVEVKKITEEG